MKRTLLIVLALILLLVSCRPNIGLIPVPPRPSVGISAGDVEENLSFPKLVNDIINKAEGISWPDSWNEVTSSTGNVEIITLNENAESVDKTYEGSVALSNYDNGNCFISGNVTVRFSGSVSDDQFSITSFRIMSSSINVRINSTSSLTAMIDGIAGEIEAVVAINNDNNVVFSTGYVKAAAKVTTEGHISVNGVSVSTDSSANNAAEESELDNYWYNPDSTELTIDTLEELIQFGELVSSGLDNFDNKTINLSKGTYDFSGIEGFSVGEGKRTDDEEWNLIDAHSFSGTFNGNESTIIGYSFSNTSEGGPDDDTVVGFFAVIENASINDLKFENCDVTTNSNTAGIAVGFAKNSAIGNVDVSNSTVQAYQGAGAVVGRLYLYPTEGAKSSITYCDASGNTVKTVNLAGYPDGLTEGEAAYNAGGIAGCVSGGVALKDSYSSFKNDISNNSVDLTGEAMVMVDAWYAGGITGTCNYANLSNNKVILDSAEEDIVYRNIPETTLPDEAQCRGYIVGYTSGTVATPNFVTNNICVIGSEETPYTYNSYKDNMISVQESEEIIP